MNIFDTTDLKPTEEPTSDIFSVTQLDPNNAQANARLNITEGNKEQAVQSLQIGKDLSIDPAAVKGDFDNFEKMHRVGQWQSQIGENPMLLEYVNGNALAAQVSQDDWKNLGEFTNKVLEFNPNAIIKQFGEKFSERILQAPAIGSWMKPEDALKYDQYGGWRYLGAPLEVFMNILSAGAEGFHGAMEEVEKQFGLGTGFARGLSGMLEHHFVSGGVLPHMVPAPDVVARLKMESFTKAIEPYIAKGEPIPVGLHPITDKLHAEQAVRDSDALMEALKSAAKTETRELAPELFEKNLVERVVGDQQIWIEADAVRALYGDKVPTPDDGLLGWVPRLQEQLQAAEKTGGDVQIPLAKWYTYADPEMAKVLDEHIRARKGGMTKQQAQLGIEVYHGSRHEFDVFGGAEHVGKGQGAASYGHPLEGGYFGEVPEVAERHRLSGMMQPMKYKWTVNGREVSAEAINFYNNAATVEAAVALRMHNANGNRAEAIKAQERMIENPRIDVPVEDVDPKFDAEVLKVLKEGDIQEVPEPKGNIYKARILRQREEFYDWDTIDRNDPRLQAVAQEANMDLTGATTGGDLYEQLATGLGQKGASELLQKHGYAGIKYLDQGSRKAAFTPERLAEEIKLREDQIKTQMEIYEAYKGAEGNPTAAYALEDAKRLTKEVEDLKTPVEKPTRNFVVFRKEDIELLERNGQVLRDTREATGLRPMEAPPEAMDPFKQIADIQRGTPEIAMTKVQHTMGGGVLNPVVEHAGDLIHRMTEYVKETSAGYEYVNEKVNRVLRYLKSEYGFEKEFNENIQANARSRGIPPEELQAQVDAALKTFGEEHAQIPALNEAHRIANQINVAIGNKNWDTAIAGLEELKKHLGSKEEWVRFASEAEAPPPEPAPMGKAQQLELPQAGTTRMEERQPFERGMAVGIPQVEYAHYLKLIEKQRAEDAEWVGARAMKEARRRQTQEWKENSRAIREEEAAKFKARPDVGADTYFREGTYNGDEVTPKPKLNKEFLTPEQQAILPKGWQSETGGMRPDDIAPLFGYKTGAEMLDGLTTYVNARNTAKMRPMDFSRRLIDMEVERRMEAEYGVLEDNILAEAKERVLAETSLDILHEETLRRATEAGLEFSIPKEEFKAQIRSEFNERRAVPEVDSAKILADVARAQRQVELALKKGDFATAFQWKQRAYIGAIEAKEAVAFEAADAQLDKTAKKFDKDGVKGVESSAADYIQQLLIQAGYDLKIAPEAVKANMQFRGAEGLEKYVDSRRDMGWEPEVSPDILAYGAKNKAQMTVGEFYDFKDAIDSLHYIGREERKIEVAGEKLEWEEFRKEIIDNIRQLPLRPRDKQGRWLYYLDAPLTRMEEMIKDLDLREELGPLFRAVIEPMMLSKAKEFDMMQDLSNYFKEVKGRFDKKWRKSLSDTIPNDSIIDPHTMIPYDLTRENLIGIMLNWGTRSNIEKFTRGYASLLQGGQKATKEQAAAFEVGVKALIDQYATKEDWAFVDAMWEPFRKFQKEGDVVARNVSGVAPKWIKPEPVKTPHGTFEGGYWPVKYDRLGSDLSVIEDREPPSTALFTKGFYRASTAKGHLKERTGYIDAVDIQSSIEQATGTMQQAIHDIAFRDAVMQVGKIFGDAGIRKEIRSRYGVEYEAQMMPWLRRIANHYAVDEQAVKWYNDWMRRVRVNLIGHALPLNLKVILSPDIGTVNPASWARFEANREANVELAMQHSKEIKHLVYNMDRDYREQLEHLVASGKFDALQRAAVDWGFKPMMKVSQEFRMATFVDQFHKAKAEGRTDHEAATIADSYVRERHGAASIVDLPAIMEHGEAMKMLTMFYGYFNTMYNWQRQLPGNVRRAEYKNFAINATGSVLVGAGFGAALFNNAKEDDSWFKIIGKALMLQPFQTVPIVREAANYFMEGYSPRTPTAGLIGGFSSAYTALKDEFTKGQAKKPIQSFANVIGLTTGLPMLQLGKTGQFLWDVNTGKQRPRNIFEWTRGLIHGEALLKKGR